MPSLESHNNQYHLNTKESVITAFTLSGLAYTKRHWQLAKDGASGKWGHRAIAIIEAIPIIGGIAALIERFTFAIKHRPARPLKNRNVASTSTSELTSSSLTFHRTRSSSQDESSKTPTPSKSQEDVSDKFSPSRLTRSNSWEEITTSENESRTELPSESSTSENSVEDLSFIESQEMYEKYNAAKAGNREAQFSLGVELHNKQHPLGMHYLEQAAINHHAEAQFRLALIELTKFGKKDYIKAREYLDSAANKGFAPAFAELGELFLKGFGGDKSEKQARKLFELGIERDDPAACVALADFIKKNEKGKSLELYRHAAELYEHGTGFQRNIPEAIRLYEQLLPEYPELQETIDRLKNLGG
ncbi:MAG: tetratricopeptide repeat protein [Parachlamydiaceae bacterium]